MWKVCLLLLLIEIDYANSISCMSCDDFKSCDHPFEIDCGPKPKCYTFRHLDTGEVTMRGCAHNCSSLLLGTGETCEDCNERDYCNGKDIGKGKDVDIHHYSRNEKGVLEISATEMAERSPLGQGFLTTTQISATNKYLFAVSILLYVLA